MHNNAIYSPIFSMCLLKSLPPRRDLVLVIKLYRYLENEVRFILIYISMCIELILVVNNVIEIKCIT